MRSFGIALFASTLSLLGAAPARDAAAPQVQAAMARMPLRFEANQGQWNPAVRYAAHAGQYSVDLTAAGPSLSFGGGSRVDLALDGSNPSPEIEPAGPPVGAANYFIGPRARWRAGVPNYSQVRYRGVYPGIDVLYYGSESQLEYDFLVAPGADPNAIRMRFQGADRVGVNARGDITVECAGGQVLQKRPVLYQIDPRDGTRRPVDGRYVTLADGAVGLRLAGYDHTRPLVIDPLLAYSSFLGGQAADQINAVKIDSNGLLYVVGRTVTSDLVATPGTYSSINQAVGANDMFIMVLDTTAAGNYNLQYVSYLGGTGDDLPAAMDLDANGNMYIVGTTGSTDFPFPGGTSLQSTNPSGTHNVFVVKFNPTQSAGLTSLLYSTYLGGALDNYGTGIAVDQAGKIYVIGTTTSTDFPVSDGAYAGVLSGAEDAFLCEIDTTASAPVYSTYLGGEGTDTGEAIAVAPNGLVYFAIGTDSAEFPLSIAPYRSSLQGVEDVIVGIVDPAQYGGNSLVYDTYFGGSDLDAVRKIAFDAKGRLLLTGFTFSRDFPTTPDAVQTYPGDEGDVFVTVLDPVHPESFLVYSTYLGGAGSDVAYDLAADPSGSILVTGYTVSPDFPVTFDALEPKWGGGIEMFLAKIKPGAPGSAGLQFSTFLGEAGQHVGAGLTFGKDGTVYVGGYSTLGFPSDAREYSGGVSDGFVVAVSGLAGQPLGINQAPVPTNRRSTPRAPRY